MNNSKDIGQEIIEITKDLVTNITAWIEKGNKQAAKRARKATLLLEKKGKVFRKLSVAESKN